MTKRRPGTDPSRLGANAGRPGADPSRAGTNAGRPGADSARPGTDELPSLAPQLGVEHPHVGVTSTFVGMPKFPVAAREELANTAQRRNLAHATGIIRNKRAAVVGELDNWEELRVAAEQIKKRTLNNLDTLLEEFEAKATAAGAVVHWARDAAEANQIVVDLVRETGADEVVKVKSMATQEIELNEALEQAGINAWETDLAELIVQLGDDWPSHILVPAIHRNRSEVREIFLRRMKEVGRPAPDDLTDDPRRLAEAARLHLRCEGIPYSTFLLNMNI